MMKPICLIFLTLFLSALESVRAGTFTVTTTADAGVGSLRQAIADAALPQNSGVDTILFSAGLSGQAISVLSTLEVYDSAGVIIDGSALTRGLTIDDGSSAAYRLFELSSGSLTLRGLTLSNGGGTTGINGGALYVQPGTAASLERCKLSGNSGADGGAIYNGGLLTLIQCTLSGNSASRGGGAVFSSTDSISGTVTGSTTMTLCTLSGNTAAVRGGAVRNNNGRTTLIHCTLSGNTAPLGAGGGVAGYGDGETETVVRHCIICGNGGSDVDVSPGSVNSFTSSGRNLIGTGNATGDFNQTGDMTGHTAATIKLSPLGSYGGGLQTRIPLPGSPAIDAAVALTPALTTDQRGFPRSVDGDGNGSAMPDIGAVEMRRAVVNTDTDQNDTPAGAQISLREALRDDGLSDNADAIVFDPGVFTGAAPVITLGSQITVTGTAVVDGSPLSGILTINDGTAGAYRLFQVQAGAFLTMRKLVLANGGGTGFGSPGGAVNVVAGGTLAQEACTLSGNSATEGGAIYSRGTLLLTNCTLSNNAATLEGGAVYSNTDSVPGTANTSTLTQCTLWGNSAGETGGGVRNFNGLTTLIHCTFSSNTAPAGKVGGVVTYGDALTDTVVNNCIIVGNSASDVVFTPGTVNSFTSRGGNLAGSGNATGDFNGPGDSTGHTLASIRLAPLFMNGGTTRTMMPLPGSPALDACAAVSGIATDQRGFSRSADGRGYGEALPDAGALEVRLLLVTTGEDENDSPPGARLSLREALREDAAGEIADHIGFNTFYTMSSYISWGNTLAFTGSVAVDGTAFTGGVTVDGGSTDGSMLNVGAGAFLALRGLTLANGWR